LANTGLKDLTVGSLFLDFDQDLYRADVSDFPAGNEVNLRWAVTGLRSGCRPLAVLCPVPDTRDSLVVVLGSLQIGPGVMILNEVLPAPDAGQGEWIELRNISDRPLDLGAFQVRDEDGDWRDLPAYLLPADDLVVVAQDPPALRQWIAANGAHGDPSQVLCADGGTRILDWESWPNLNNSPPVTREFADRIYLADSTGTVIDHLTFGGSGEDWDRVPLPPRGRSLERLGPSPADPLLANWEPSSLASGGSPGCPNSFSPPGIPEATLEVSSRILDRQDGSGPVGITLMVPDQGCGFRLRVFNLWGEKVRELGGDELGPGTRLRYWTGDDDDGRPVPPGGYILVGEATGPDEAVLSRTRIVVGVR